MPLPMYGTYWTYTPIKAPKTHMDTREMSVYHGDSN